MTTTAMRPAIASCKRWCARSGRGFGPSTPIIRYGGDEFVCGLGGTDAAEAERRFESIEVAIESETSVGISVGLAVLAEGDTAKQLMERADAAMLEVKAAHHSRE
jgi:GGDEF domain-containing protein